MGKAGELIARLKARAGKWKCYGEPLGEDERLASDAATLLASQEAEIARLKDVIERDRTKAAEARVAEAVERLHRIIELDHQNMGPESRATKIARDALNGGHTHG